ncbi:MAG: hypothetical protein FWG90_02840 [Oscillospiraceae bacterium]|nr:hypothetical protein [Oscillospiraceae bacterium]
MTDEEQDVNREIREIAIDRSEIVEKVGDSALYLLFKDNRKYRYNERHDFGFNVFIDDRARGQQKEEMGIRILTPYYSQGGDLTPSELGIISMREDNIVVALPQNISFMEEMEQALQIDVYLRRHAGDKGTDALGKIIAAKNDESQERKKRYGELLKEALKLAEIYANGAKLDIKAKDPATRISEAFRALVESKYTKLHFIDTPFYTVEELRTLLLEKGMQVKVDGMENTPNKSAVEDVTDYITRNSYSNITVRTLIDYFGKSPYRWKENDTIGVLLMLFKRQEVRLELSSQAFNSGDVRVVDYLTKRDTNDRVVIKVRVKVTTDLLNIAKDLARDLFSHSALPNDEDGIMAKFKDLAKNELYERSDSGRDVSVKGMLGHYETARYPGKQVLEAGKKLLESITAINDVRTFFETLRTSKEDLLDFEEDVADVRKFFIG